MRLQPFFLLLLAVLLSNAGCLSLGGRTVHVQESETTKSRITTLEHRVGALEQMMRPVETAGVMPQ